MRAAEILAAVGDVPPHVAQAIWDLDARAYGRNEPVRYNESETYMKLRAGVKAAGSETAFARKAGITKQSMSDMLSGKRPMSPRVLKVIGLRRVETKVYTLIDV